MPGGGTADDPYGDPSGNPYPKGSGDNPIVVSDSDDEDEGEGIKRLKSDQSKDNIVSNVTNLDYIRNFPWGPELFRSARGAFHISEEWSSYDIALANYHRLKHMALIQKERHSGKADLPILAQQAAEWGVFMQEMFPGIPPVMTLPNELLGMILDQLLRIDPATLMESVPLVCRRLRWSCTEVRGIMPEAYLKPRWPDTKLDSHGNVDYFHFKGRVVWPPAMRLRTQRANRFLGLVQQKKYFPRIQMSIKDIKKLHLAGLFLPKLPEGICLLTELNELGLNRITLECLPESIGLLGKLTQLSALNNRLKEIPQTIGGLAKLEKLDLSVNQLTTLPTEIGNLVNLTYLNLAFNELTTLPTEIGNLTALKELILEANQLTTLPTEIGNLTALEELFLANNQLTTLPTEIGNLVRLRKLHLAQNPNLRELPREIENLVHLQVLTPPVPKRSSDN